MMSSGCIGSLARRPTKLMRLGAGTANMVERRSLPRAATPMPIPV